MKQRQEELAKQAQEAEDRDLCLVGRQEAVETANATILVSYILKHMHL